MHEVGKTVAQPHVVLLVIVGFMYCASHPSLIQFLQRRCIRLIPMPAAACTISGLGRYAFGLARYPAILL